MERIEDGVQRRRWMLERDAREAELSIFVGWVIFAFLVSVAISCC